MGVGLQRHHQASYKDAVHRIQDGAIGKVLCLRANWIGGPPAKRPPERTGLTEMQYQLRNWYFFTWLSGDHIVEQHIHNLDVCNWIMNGHPVEAQGMGGRQVRSGKDWGQIFDHHFVEFTYADGTKIFSQCRQIAGCWTNIAEYALGSTGSADLAGGVVQATGTEAWRGDAPRVGRGRKVQAENPYQIEHDVLFDAIRNNRAHNEVSYAAMTTMTAILGRMATYSGKVVKWDEAFQSQLSLAPEQIAWDAKPRDLPDASGAYAVAMPGTTRSF